MKSVSPSMLDLLKKFRMRILLMGNVLLSLGLSAAPIAAQTSGFEFVIPGDDAKPTITDRSGLLSKPAGAKGFVTRQANHFVLDGKPIRFWGVNLCFGANFPTHDEADRIAPHLAKLGINAVRFHHMDMQAAPNGIWDAEIQNGQRKLSVEMIDRLDYFLARLHEQGIYANLNLHVSRTLTEAEGFPQLVDGLWWTSSNKWVMYYDQDVQGKLKEYSRELLTHQNPYRNNLSRVDDPGIALIEMLNENFFSEKGLEIYDRLPKRFQDSFVAAWNRWLTQEYKTGAAMLAAWNERQPKLGERVFSSAEFKESLADWKVNLPAAELPTELGVPGPNSESFGLRLMPQKIYDQDHRQQLLQTSISLEKDKPYSLSFWVRADQGRPFRAELSTSQGGEWRSVGLFESMTATPQWQQIKRVILSSESIDKEINLVFTIGSDLAPIEFAGIELRSGVEPASIPNDQSLERQNVAVPTAEFPIGSHLDMKRFMVETERAWILELKSFLKDELGVKVPITASQLNYHPAEIVEETLDFADLHNYWHHPMFPSGQDWNAEKWTVQNEPMEARPTLAQWPTNSLLMRSGWRFSKLPMTMTEWNYSEPSFNSGGAVPMAAIMAGLQDWDGVFFFDYDAFSRGDRENPFFRDSTMNYFSFNGAPTKLALLSQMANVYLRGDLKPLVDSADSPLRNPIDGRFALSKKIGVSSSATPATTAAPPSESDLLTPDGQVRWTSDGKAQGQIELNTPATRGLWGTIAHQSAQLGTMKIEVGGIEPNYGFVIYSTTDGQPIERANSAILLVVSHSENQDMGWNEDKTSVGTAWGHGPTLAYSFQASVSLSIEDADQQIKVYSLDGTGSRMNEIPVHRSGNRATIEVSPAHKTIWYEVQCE